MTDLDQEEGFLGRWSRRKAEVLKEQEAPDLSVPVEAEAAPAPAPVEEEPPPPPPSDEDMPPIESLDEESDYSGFLSPNVSEELRKRALRKLFSSAVFNQVDGLDDYDEDFTKFEPLGDLVTADMKHQMEMEAKRKLEAISEDEEEAVEDISEEEDGEAVLEAESDGVEQAEVVEEIDNELDESAEAVDTDAPTSLEDEK